MDAMAKPVDNIDHRVVDLISENAIIRANITTQNDIRVDGVVEGNIVTSRRLVVGPKAIIKGDIKAKSADCFGKIKGDLLVDTVLNIKHQAEIDGNISASLLSIETGALFTGCCNMKKENR